MHRFATLLVAFALLAAAAHGQSTPPDVVWEQDAGARTAALSPDGSRVVAGGQIPSTPFVFGRLDLLDAADGRVLVFVEAHDRSGRLGGTNEVAFSPDGSTIASAHGTVYCSGDGGCFPDGPGLFTWASASLTSLAGRDDLPNASSVDFGPDASRLAVGFFYDNDGAVRIVDASSLTVEQTVDGHHATTYQVRFSPLGDAFASVGDDGFLRVWDAATGAERFAVEHGSFFDDGVPVSVAYSPDGTVIATGGDGLNPRVKTWDATTGAPLLDLDASVVPGAGEGDVVVAFTPNGRYLVGGLDEDDIPGVPDSAVRFWDAATGAVVLELFEPVEPGRSGIGALAFSPALDDRFVYTRGGVVKMVEVPIGLADAPGVTVTAEPVDPPIEIPPEGGTFAYRLTLTNATGESQAVDVWTSISGPVDREPAFGPRRMTLPAGATRTRTLSQRIPGQAPSGTYRYTASVGTFGEPALDSDGFDFVKLPGATASAGAHLAAHDADPSLPAGIELATSPNPFRDRATVRLTVTDAQPMRVELADVLGRHVATLYEGAADAGTILSLAVDGAGLAPGVYVLRVRGRSQSATRLLVRAR